MKKLNGILCLMLIAVLLLASMSALAEETDGSASDSISIINLDELQNALTSQRNITVRSNLWEASNKLIASKISLSEIPISAGENAEDIQISAEMREALRQAGVGYAASAPVSTGEMIAKIAGALADSGTPATEGNNGVNLLFGDQNGWRQYMNLATRQLELARDSRLQFPEGENTGLINTNPASALLWGDGILPIAPGQSKLFYVSTDTGETTPAGSIDVKENESGELESDFTPAPEVEPRIVNVFGDAIPAYTYDTPLYLKLDGAKPIAWEYILRYQGGNTIARQVLNEGQEMLEIDSIIKDIIVRESLSAYRAMEINIIAQYDEKGVSEITLPVQGIPFFVQADGSPLPELMNVYESISMKLLASNNNGGGTWFIRAYDENGDYIGFDFNQRGSFATLSPGSMDVNEGYSRYEIAHLEIKHSLTGSEAANIYLRNKNNTEWEGLKFTTGSFTGYGSITLSANEKDFLDVIHRKNGTELLNRAIEDAHDVVVEAHFSFSPEVKTLDFNLLYGFPLIKWTENYHQHLDGSFNAFMGGAEEVTQSMTLVVSLYDKVSGELVDRGFVNYVHYKGNDFDPNMDFYLCPACNNYCTEYNSHKAPCGEVGHFTCQDGITYPHYIHEACGQPACIGDHSLYHDGSYGEGHYACLGEKTHMCIRCQTDGIPCEDIVAHADVACENIMHCNGTGDHSLRHDAAYGLHGVCAEEQKHFCIICQTDDIFCSEIVAHASAACGNIAHCNGNGMEHDPCNQCKKPLCSGTEHGKGICDKTLTITDPVIIGLGDTVNLNDYQIDYDANTEADIRLEGFAD